MRGQGFDCANARTKSDVDSFVAVGTPRESAANIVQEPILDLSFLTPASFSSTPKKALAAPVYGSRKTPEVPHRHMLFYETKPISRTPSCIINQVLPPPEEGIGGPGVMLK